MVPVITGMMGGSRRGGEEGLMEGGGGGSCVTCYNGNDSNHDGKHNQRLKQQTFNQQLQSFTKIIVGGIKIQRVFGTFAAKNLP